MNVYVGMDVHRKRSQIAVVEDTGDEQRNRNVPNGHCCIEPECAGKPSKVEALLHEGRQEGVEPLDRAMICRL